MAAEEEEVQPGDSRGLEGSSAGAGETVCPCSPSVSFSSRVDMRVLSPLRELVSTWGQRGWGSRRVATAVLLPLLPRHRKDPHKEEKALAEVTCTTVGDEIAKLWRKSSARFHPNVDITPLYLVLLTDCAD